MERIEDFAALSPLLTAQLKPGVYTNHLMAPRRLRPGDRGGADRVPLPRRAVACAGAGRDMGLYTFYWQRGAELCPPPAAEAAVHGNCLAAR